uniref:WASP homolog associated with actin, golgi membranes and microtubules n=1 Tax=Neovison vison TaxID=452646 RepID=A0A8C7BF33_NEOVI
MDDEQPDSLEGWVPVRDDLFAEPERRQLRFLVAWNDAEAKFARIAETEPETAVARVLQGHEKAQTMVALMNVYQEEDEAYQELVTGATMFFQYLLKPFRDMREVATLCKLSILKSLDEDNLGPKRIVALEKEAKEWTRQAEEAIVSIQDITVNYFKETVKALAGMQKQMEQDKKRFGQAAWATATPRLEKLKLMLARETLQLMRARELCLNHKRAEIHRKMEDLPEQEKNTDVVDELEIQYYEIQLELYEVKFEILKYEEILLITQLDSIKRLIKDKEEEVVYYDPCESPEELGALAGAAGLPGDPSAEVKELSRQCGRLESQRGRICARRARLRNRQDQCRENHRLRLQLAEESVKHFHQHHRIQVKRDKMKEEEQKIKEWINQERKKTLQRLRAFKERCPGGSVLKTPCSEPAAPHLPAGPSPQTPPMASGSHLSSGEAGGAPVSEVSHTQTPGDPGVTPLHSARLGRTFPAANESVCVTKDTLNHVTNCPGPGVRPPDGTCSVCSTAGSMDEVLAALRRGRSPLQRPAVPALTRPHASFNEQLLAAIRQGVKLKKVHSSLSPSPSNKPASDLERSIKAALQRIQRVSADSEEEDSEEQGPGGSEWDH